MINQEGQKKRTGTIAYDGNRRLGCFSIEVKQWEVKSQRE